jgi:hypothetical protein
MSAAEKLKESSVPKSFGPKTSSKRNDRFTLILIPNETGISKKFTLPKSLLYFVFVFGFCFVGVFTAMCLYVGKMAKLSNENEKLKAENHSIRSEATFLVTKLKQVQDNLTRVDKFSNQVFAEASKIDPKEAKSQKVKKSLLTRQKCPRNKETLGPKPFKLQIQWVHFRQKNLHLRATLPMSRPCLMVQM